ncbi:MAG: hypothetical protein ACREM6_04680 [Vulcanimicrobiaceae bacterium]
MYVDYGEYHGPNRIPVAGTEYPRLLANPLEVFGDLALRDVFAAFNRSDFQEAERLAQRLADRLYEPREAQCLERLARGYAAWDRFDFQAAQTALADARVLLDQHSGQGGWSWAPAVTEALSENLLGLDSLAKIEAKPNRVIDGLPLLAWYLSAAERLLAAKKISLAVLLTYAAVERYSDLCLLDDFGLDDEKPNYSTVKVKLDEQRERYVAAGKQLFGAGYKYRDPDGPLGFAAGAQLLAALSPMRLDVGDLGTLTGLSAARNKCEYEHGFLPKIPSDEDAKRYLRKAKDVIARGCTTPADLQRQIDAYSFPKLIS